MVPSQLDRDLASSVMATCSLPICRRRSTRRCIRVHTTHLTPRAVPSTTPHSTLLDLHCVGAPEAQRFHAATVPEQGEAGMSEANLEVKRATETVEDARKCESCKASTVRPDRGSVCVAWVHSLPHGMPAPHDEGLPAASQTINRKDRFGGSGLG